MNERRESERGESRNTFLVQPKKFKDPKILCLNLELELKAEKVSSEPLSFPLSLDE